jgi:hypothetical protein
MSQHTHKFILSGHTWEEKPSCWRNFVEYVMHTQNCHHNPHDDILYEIELELRKLGLSLENDGVIGTPENLTAWMLTYA